MRESSVKRKCTAARPREHPARGSGTIQIQAMDITGGGAAGARTKMTGVYAPLDTDYLVGRVFSDWS